MKIKLDENIPLSLVAALHQLGHDVDTVLQENLKGADDGRIWIEIAKAGRFLVTQDLDFSDIVRLTQGLHPGVLLVRLRNPGRCEVAERIEAVFKSENVEDWKGRLVVVSEKKVRVRQDKG